MVVATIFTHYVAINILYYYLLSAKNIIYFFHEIYIYKFETIH